MPFYQFTSLLADLFWFTKKLLDILHFSLLMCAVMQHEIWLMDILLTCYNFFYFTSTPLHQGFYSCYFFLTLFNSSKNYFSSLFNHCFCLSQWPCLIPIQHRWENQSIMYYTSTILSVVLKVLSTIMPSSVQLSINQAVSNWPNTCIRAKSACQNNRQKSGSVINKNVKSL